MKYNIKYPGCFDKPYGKSWVMQAPVVSSSHFKRKDLKVLLADRGTLFVEEPRADHYNVVLTISDGHGLDGVSAQFTGVIEAFRELGYHYIRIDADGEVIKGLPTFNRQP